jgi:long-chain acyl-CoA synthetase
MRLHDLLTDGAMRRPAATALTEVESGVACTYAEAAREAGQIAAALAGLGIRRGDRVGLFAPNRIEYPLAMFGIWRAGAVSAHLSVQFGEALDYYLRDARPAVLVYSADRQADVDRHADALDDVPHLVCLDGPHGRAIGWRDLLQGAGAPPPDTTRGDDAAHLSWTSGSTGKPKGVVIGHEITARACRAIAERLRLSAADITYGPTSLSSSYHLVANLLPGLFAQARVGLGAQWDAARAFDDMERLGVSYLPANAHLLAQLLDDCRRRERAPRGLRLMLTGGVPTPPALKRAWRDEFAICLAESYGQSELGGFIGLGPPDLPADRHLLASGPSLPDRVVRVIDAGSGAACAPGVVGEIVVEGGCMIGYRDKPDLTAQVVRGGWLHTGDLGHMDRDGYVFFRGRIGELLQVDGETWFPRDAEDAALEHPAVLHAALIGARLPTGAHRPVLFVALRPGAGAGLATALAEHISQQLGRPAAALEVRILDALPLTPTSKIDRPALRAQTGSPP